jgi:hypothetical protein
LGLFGDSVNLGTRKVHDLHRTYHRLRNHFGHTQWYSFLMWVKWKLVWVHLESIKLSVGAWFASIVPRAWKSFWAHLTKLLGDVGSFGNSVNLDIR